MTLRNTFDMERDAVDVWDFVEAVTVEQARLRLPPPPDGELWDLGAADYAATAKRRNLTQRELAASGGVYTGDDTTILIPVVSLSQGLTIKAGDAIRIDEEDKRWTVLEASLNKWRSTWRLTCRDLVLAHDLRELIRVERADVSYDAAGVRVKAWPTGPEPRGGGVLYDQLPARVQPVTKDVADQRGIRGFEAKFTVTVGRQVPLLTDQDRLLWRGKYLDITGVRNPERIDMLPEVEAEMRV